MMAALIIATSIFPVTTAHFRVLVRSTDIEAFVPLSDSWRHLGWLNSLILLSGDIVDARMHGIASNARISTMSRCQCTSYFDDLGNACFAIIMCLNGVVQTGIKSMAITRKKTNKRTKRVAWTKQHVNDLKTHSKSKTPVTKIAKSMKRSPGAIRQKALSLGISIGHRRWSYS